MYRSNSSCKQCGRGNSQSTIKVRSCTKFRNNGKNISTQTNNKIICEEHNQQITQLLTEVAIALRHKAKLENVIEKLKNYNMKIEQQYHESKEKYEQEIENLKKDNFETSTAVSSLKITHLGEQNELLNEISNLKSQIQELQQQKDAMLQEHLYEKQSLEKQIELNSEELNKEIENNANLKLKIGKYRMKFKNFLGYIQNLLDECKENKIAQSAKDIKTKEQNNSNIKFDAVESNLEDLILTELFFKPNPIPQEVSSTFFKFPQTS